MVAVRAAPFGFAATEYDTLPLPMPVPEETVSHESLLVADQAQPVSAKSWKLPVEAAVPGRALVALKVKLQLPSSVRLARARPPVSRQKRLCQRHSIVWSCCSCASPTASDFRFTRNVGTRKTRVCPVVYAGARAPFAAMT